MFNRSKMPTVGNRQEGWTMWSLIFTLFILGTIAWIGLKIVPLYMDNSTIRTSLKTLQNDRSLADASYDEIYELIEKRLDINGIRTITEDDIEFVEEENYTQVRIDYEKRLPLVSNIDIILTFKNHVNLAAPQ
jgi:hypothetical protein